MQNRSISLLEFLESALVNPTQLLEKKIIFFACENTAGFLSLFKEYLRTRGLEIDNLDLTKSASLFSSSLFSHSKITLIASFAADEPLACLKEWAFKLSSGMMLLTWESKLPSSLTVAPEAILVNCAIKPNVLRDYIWLCLDFLGYKLTAPKQKWLLNFLTQPKNLTLDGLVTLLTFVYLMPLSKLNDLDLYLQDWVLPDVFDLVNALFAGKKKLFFHIWYQLQDLYPPQYWLVFLMGRIVAGIQARARVCPTTLQKLIILYKELYEMEASIKTGTASPQLVSLFVKHFA